MNSSAPIIQKNAPASTQILAENGFHSGRGVSVAKAPAASALPVATRSSIRNSDAISPLVRLIPLSAVCEMLGLKRSAVLDKVAKGELPAPIKFGASKRAAARWIEQEIVDYVWAKAAQRQAYGATLSQVSPEKEVAMR